MAPSHPILYLALLASTVAAQRTATVWGQCAGSGYSGPTACAWGNYCNYGNPWYSQCIPGSEDDPLDDEGSPDTPLQTNTGYTVITIGGDDGRRTVVTTDYTYLTPSTTIYATPRPSDDEGDGGDDGSWNGNTGGGNGGGSPPQTTVIRGTTYTIIHDAPISSNKANHRRGRKNGFVPATATDVPVGTPTGEDLQVPRAAWLAAAVTPQPTAVWTTLATVVQKKEA